MENTNRYKISYQKVTAIMSDKTIPSGAKLVLYNLISHLGGKYFSFPSQITIAKDLGLSDRQVRYHLKLLKQRGIIDWSLGATNPKNNHILNVNKYNLTHILVEE